MNYVIIGTVILCIAAVVAVSMNFFRRCKCNEEPADEDEKILEKAGHLIEDLDPVEGPEPTDTDNPYTVTFNEPLEVADSPAAVNIDKLPDISVALKKDTGISPADIGKALESLEKKDIVRKQDRKRKADTAKAETGKKKSGRKRKADTAKTEPKQKKPRTVKQSDIVKAAKKLRVKKGE